MTSPTPLAVNAASSRIQMPPSTEGCPTREVLKHVTSMWGVLVLIALRDGTHRFSALRRKVSELRRRGSQGVSEKMLTQTLQLLEIDGFVDRHSFPVVPPHVEYSLTVKGQEVAALVAGLVEWVEANLPQPLSVQD